MAISLQKGGNISLSKEAPGLNKIHVGLGWDVRTTDGSAFDLDASVFLLNDTGKVRSSVSSRLHFGIVCFPEICYSCVHSYTEIDLI